MKVKVFSKTTANRILPISILVPIEVENRLFWIALIYLKNFLFELTLFFLYESQSRLLSHCYIPECIVPIAYLVRSALYCMIFYTWNFKISQPHWKSLEITHFSYFFLYHDLITNENRLTWNCLKFYWIFIRKLSFKYFLTGWQFRKKVSGTFYISSPY